jgi:hypothetical protein
MKGTLSAKEAAEQGQRQMQEGKVQMVLKSSGRKRGNWVT